MKYFILITFAIIGNVSVAQKTVLVRPTFQPNTSYIITRTSRDSSQVTVTGSEEALKRLKAIGKQLQETLLTEVDQEIKAILGALKADGSSPIEMIFHPETSNIKSTGKTTTEIGTEAHLFGSYSSEMIITIDSITGEYLSDVAQKKIRSDIEANNSSNFPEKPIRIGESFVQKAPKKMQLAGSEVELSNTITYQLKEVKNNRALFDVTSVMNGVMNNEKVKFSTSGDATGTAEYDIEKKIMSKFQVTAIMATTMDMGEFTLHIKSVTKNFQTLTIE
jgi:hypothetical protein